MPSRNFREDLEVISADKFLLLRQGTIDPDNVDIVEGHEFLFNRPLRLLTSDADTLSLIEGHRQMLDLGKGHHHPKNVETAGEDSNRLLGTMVILGQKKMRTRRAKSPCTRPSRAVPISPMRGPGSLLTAG